MMSSHHLFHFLLLVPSSCYFLILFLRRSYLLLCSTFRHYIHTLQVSMGYLVTVLAPLSDINYNNCSTQICFWQVYGAKRWLCELLYEVITHIARDGTVCAVYNWPLHILPNLCFYRTLRAGYRLKHVTLSI